MAQNFGGQQRHIIASTYCIGGKRIIDENCNLKIPNSTITARTGTFKKDLTICANLLVDHVKPKESTFIDISGVEIGNGNIKADTINANIKTQGCLGANIVEADFLREFTPGHEIYLKSNLHALLPDAQIFSNVLKTNYIFEHTLGHGIVLQNNTQVNGNLSVTGNLNGNICSRHAQIHTLAEKVSNSGVNVSGNLNVEALGAKVPGEPIQLYGNLTIDDDLDIHGNVIIRGSKLTVDRICEWTPGNGVCIGAGAGVSPVSSTINPDAVTEGTVTGDAIWQSFVVTQSVCIGTVNATVSRLPGFFNTSMEARLYQGVGTGGTLLASVLIANYSGGDIDFSPYKVTLHPGSYTLQLDYPINNDNNYIWFGHDKLPGDPTGSSSLITLHLQVFTSSPGGLKVTAKNTCVENILKLEFPDSNCVMEIVDMTCDANVGTQCNGLINVLVTCFTSNITIDECTGEVTTIVTSNTVPKTLSFDSEGTIIKNLSNCKINVVEANVLGDGDCGNGYLAFDIKCGDECFSKTISFDPDKIFGNILSDNITPKTANGTIEMCGNVLIKEKLDVLGNVCIHSSKLFVDNICEFNDENGICIGPFEDPILVSTFAGGAPEDVTGDSLWQSFQVTTGFFLNAVNPDVVRLGGFEFTPMDAILYQGIGTGGAVLGTVNDPIYNGGGFNFSPLGIFLAPGSYTVQLDYPPNNLSNYVWNGHDKLFGDPVGVASGTTLHLTVTSVCKGALKVTEEHTCIQNTLKLDFRCIGNSNCYVEFVDANLDAGIFGNGALCVDLTCDGNTVSKKVSFDGNKFTGDLLGNICGDTAVQGNLVVEGNTTVEGNLLVDIDVFVTGNVTANKLIGNLLGNICGNTTVEGALIIDGNIKIMDTLFVDNIRECSPLNGVCIGPFDEGNTISTVAVSTPETATGDALWQSFEVTGVPFEINIVNPDVVRLGGFAFTPMDARLYAGVGTGGALLATVNDPLYNGGAFDFSTTGLILAPGFYTIQLDYPPNNLNNYTWNGHDKLPGEPDSVQSDTTLDMVITEVVTGALKVTEEHTCVQNILKLDFTAVGNSNCVVEFVDAGNVGGECGNGFLDLMVSCDGANAEPKRISFDGLVKPFAQISANPYSSDANVGLVQVLFDNVDQDLTGDMANLTLDPGNVIITSPGVYMLNGSIAYDYAAGSGVGTGIEKFLQLRIETGTGTVTANNVVVPVANVFQEHQVSYIAFLDVGDQISLSLANDETLGYANISTVILQAAKL